MTKDQNSPNRDLEFLPEKTVLIMDVVDSVRLADLDDARFIRHWKLLVNRVRAEVLPATRGVLVKSLGDGLLALFDDPRSAVAAAFHTLKLLVAVNSEPANEHDERTIRLRMAINTGSVYSDDLDVYGSTVNTAARLTELAGPNIVVIGAAAAAGLTHGLDAELIDLGLRRVRSLPDPIRAFLAQPPEAGHTSAGRSYLAAGRQVDDLRPTLAVLNVRADSTNTDHALLGRLLADEIARGLGKTWELRVTSRLSSSAQTLQGLNAREVAQRLNADFLLSGSLYEHAGRLRMQFELINGRSDTVVWSHGLQRAYDDLAALQIEVTQEVASRVAAAVANSTLREIVLLPWNNLHGYASLLGSIERMHGVDRTRFDQAGHMLKRLCEQWHDKAAVHAWHAQWHVIRMSHGWSPDPRDTLAQAQKHAESALAIDPASSLALTIDGNVRSYLLRDFSIAHQRYAHALEANANDVIAHALRGASLAWQGACDLAVKHARTAIGLAPLDPMRFYLYCLAATAHVSAGEYQQAIDLSRESLRMNAVHLPTHKGLAIALGLAGRTEEARQAGSILRALDPNFTLASFREHSPASVSPRFNEYLKALAIAGVPE